MDMNDRASMAAWSMLALGELGSMTPNTPVPTKAPKDPNNPVDQEMMRRAEAKRAMRLAKRKSK